MKIVRRKISGATLTRAQVALLYSHFVPFSRVFDATGMKRHEYPAVMRELGCAVAIGVAPCRAAGHRMRTRAGHCFECKPVRLVFQERFQERGEIYVATSRAARLTKIGVAGSAVARIQSLNWRQYGGAMDWELRFSRACDNAGRVEFEAHRKIGGSRAKTASQVTFRELFQCGGTVAIRAVKAAIQEVTGARVGNER